MSVTELPNRDDAPAGGYGLTPPQDVAAEQSVLGAMLLSKDAIADVVEVLRGHDFYRPAHEVIYESIIDLYGRGEPADAVMVASALQKSGEIGRIGGAPYLHTLVSSVPSAANAGYYAHIVRERAILRRLVEAGTRITQLGYNGDGEADDIVDRAQAEVYNVTERRASEDYLPLSEIMEGALDEIEAIGSRAGEMVGVPTGFTDLDTLTNGLHPGQMVIVAARPAVGKALALDTPLPTPTGWATMGDVQVGDMLIGADGKPTRVVAATDVLEGRPCYKVEFSDGTVIVADANHQWPTADRSVVTTEHMARHSGRRYDIALDEAFVCPDIVRSSPPAQLRSVVGVRAVRSVPVRCVEVDAADHLYLAGRSCIPTHNSTLGLDVARAASIKHQLSSVIFSLEMSRNEITMRLLSAEAKVPLHHMRSGQMTDDDWNRIARSTGEVSSAPLFIDDSPNMTMMEIRAKCRRLKQRHDLRLVIVDYLQLMTSGKKVESRQQEVSEFSRSLKLLAKEIEVPVIAICQLNRGPEQRTDKKPMLSDLRESGCVPGSTRLLRADTGAEVTIGELVANGDRDIPVWSLDDTLRYVPRKMTHAFPSGRKETFRVSFASGKEVDATANHPFLTYDGWKPLGELAVGSRIAVPRHVPAPLVAEPRTDAEVTALADDVGYMPPDKHIPEKVFSLPKRQLGLFLRRLWATDGSVSVQEDGLSGQIDYTSSSRELVHDMSRLLLRFGVSTGVMETQSHAGRDREFKLSISGRDEQLRFLREIGCHGDPFEARDQLLAVLERQAENTDADTVPGEVWQRVRRVLTDRSASDQSVGGANRSSPDRECALGRAPLGRVAAVLDDADLEMDATNDVLWDRMVSIEPLGEQDVFDATVPGTHNFVANGVALHNSLEQDADMVVLLHREDAYEKESPRAGEADFIVAKHRNGPTATITVAFQGHYSRFVDMAQ